jgi:hypothetical protein
MGTGAPLRVSPPVSPDRRANRAPEPEPVRGEVVDCAGEDPDEVRRQFERRWAL